jgi:ribosomal protein S12 methylthiotransferase
MELKPTVYLESLGCAKNLVDSEIIAGHLNQAGFGFTPAAEEAEIIIVNTCAFIEEAVEEALEIIRRLSLLKRNGICRMLVVAGCLPQRYGTKINAKSAALKDVDFFVGGGEIYKIAQLLEEEKRNHSKPEFIKPDALPFLPDHNTPRIPSTPFYTAYLKIAEGCSHHCSFCTIPAIKGPYRSRTPESIIAEGQILAENGVREVNLIAQDTTAYGLDLPGKPGLDFLLKHLSRDTDLQWIRILYGHPNHLSPAVLAVIKEEQKACNYIDLPLQHISDPLLKKMGRKTTSSRIKEKISEMRSIIPDLFLRTTFIVGFPGETNDDFIKLIQFVKEIQFEHLGAFKYSDEEGTRAFKLKDKVEPSIIEDRYHELMSTQSLISSKINHSLIGTRQTVLIEGVDIESGVLTGRTPFQAPDIDGIVFITKGKAPPGVFAEVTVTDAETYDLFGEIKKITS